MTRVFIIIKYTFIFTVVCALALDLEDQLPMWSKDPLKLLPLETLVAWREHCPAVVARCMAVECSFEVVAASVNDNKALNAEEIWSAILCLKRDVACPVQGGWSPWSTWSACSARCGHGASVRVRSCSHPSPSSAAFACIDARLERRGCQGVACADVTDDNWSLWSAWSTCAAHLHRRTRSCTGDAPQSSLSACSGERVQVEECEGDSDVASPTWSCWSPWSPCSTTCGRGRKARMRGCTGVACPGRHVERSTCYQRPCYSFTHQVVTFNGLGEVMFAATGSELRILHVYVRFLPLSSTGTLVALKDPECGSSCPSIAIFLSSGRVNLEWSFVATLFSEEVVDLDRWHEILVSASTNEIKMRIDDEERIYSAKIDYYQQVDFDRRIVLGSNFSGQISDVIINFKPLKLWMDKNKGTLRNPYSLTNVAYEKANIEEGFQSTVNGSFLTIPCFKDAAQWSIEMSIQPKSDEGLIIFMQNPSVDNWLNVSLQNLRVSLTVCYEGLVEEKRSDVDLEAKAWLELVLVKNKGSNSIDMTVNGGNPLILVLAGVNGKAGKKKAWSQANEGKNFNDAMYSMCDGEMFVGGVPLDSQILSSSNYSKVKSLSATIGHVILDGELLDLSVLSKERFAGLNNSSIYLSSRTASSVKLYRTTPLASGSWVQLSCYVSRLGTMDRNNVTKVRWYKLDEAILESEHFTIKYKGRYIELKINISMSTDNVEGFFTCRDERQGVAGQRNLVTYGVWTPYKQQRWDPRWALSVTVAVVLAGVTVLWLFAEGIQDLLMGHGLFRDKILTKEEEAKEIIAFLEKPECRALVGSRSAIRLARAKIRRKAGLHFTSSIQFTAERDSFRKVIKDNSIEFDSEEETAESILYQDNQIINANLDLSGVGGKTCGSEPKRISYGNTNNPQDAD